MLTKPKISQSELDSRLQEKYGRRETCIKYPKIPNICEKCGRQQAYEKKDKIVCEYCGEIRNFKAHPLTLSDILSALEKIEIMVSVFLDEDSTLTLSSAADTKFYNWNLKKNLYRDQDEETKQFILNELLK